MGIETAVMAGVSLAGAGLNMMQSNSATSSSANANARAMYARARAMQEQAKWVKAASALRSEDMQRNIDMTIGRQVAAAGASGVAQAGSVISNAASTAAQGARDLFNEKFQTDANVANIETNANLATGQGNSIQEQAGMQNNMRLINFLGGAGLSAISAGAGTMGGGSGSYTGATTMGTSLYGSPAPNDMFRLNYGGPR